MTPDDAEPRRRGRRGAGGGNAPGGSGAAKPRTVWRGAPGKPASNQGSREVIVRVTGRTKSGPALLAQLSYLSRKGELPSLLSTGRVLHGLDDMRALRDRWVADNAAYALSRVEASQSVGVVLSMPSPTPLETVVASVQAWAETHIAPMTEYLIVPHGDRAHAHCHVSVRSVGQDGLRLRATLDDIQLWRETFAGEMTNRGTEALATSRQEKLELIRTHQIDRYLERLPALGAER